MAVIRYSEKLINSYKIHGVTNRKVTMDIHRLYKLKSENLFVFFSFRLIASLHVLGLGRRLLKLHHRCSFCCVQETLTDWPVTRQSPHIVLEDFLNFFVVLVGVITSFFDLTLHFPFLLKRC